MKNKKVKLSLLAFACVFIMMSTGLSVTAAEAIEPEEVSLMSVRFTGGCGCTISSMDYETVSRRNCAANDEGTHTSEYNISFICPNGHGRQSTTKYFQEAHVPCRFLKDERHDKDGFHVYSNRCIGCDGIIKALKLDCMAPSDAEYGHAVP